MLQNSPAFSGFSVDDQAKAQEFYKNVLGLDVIDNGMGLNLKLNGVAVFIYEKLDHQPASFTVLNFIVEDINIAVDELVAKGVVFERYDNLPAKQDERGILRGLPTNDGPDIAWFKDPAGNVMSILQES